jgi:hypothetical protein
MTVDRFNGLFCGKEVAKDRLTASFFYFGEVALDVFPVKIWSSPFYVFMGEEL